MELTPAPRESGIALFMVMAAITVLSILVTEFVYVTQVNTKMAYDGMDQIRAHYLAKSALKLSLLRLKAYQQVKNIASGVTGGSGANVQIPRKVMDQIWSFPLFFPIPENLPGLSMTEKDAIKKFQDSSGLIGKFSATIESESARFNLNTLLSGYSYPNPEPSASPSPGSSPAPSPSASPAPLPSYNPQVAQNTLKDFLTELIANHSKDNPDFAEEYKDLRLDDYIDGIISWADWNYDSRTASQSAVPRKGAPFYSVGELHMVYPMEDGIFDVLEPAVTVAATPGINLNSMDKKMLKILVPNITDDEGLDFFKYRDSDEVDNSFKSPDDFFKYIETNISAFGKSASTVSDLRTKLEKAGYRFITDEKQFRITVQATVNNSTRLIEARVTLLPAKKEAPETANQPSSPPTPVPVPSTQPTGMPYNLDAGLKITFMRIL